MSTCELEGKLQAAVITSGAVAHSEKKPIVPGIGSSELLTIVSEECTNDAHWPGRRAGTGISSFY